MSKLGRGLIKSLQEAVAEGKGTMSLYKDKPFLYRLKRALYTSDILDPIFSVYYSIQSFFSNVRRVVEFIPHAWNHRDWDYGFVLRFNIMLHERLYKGIFDKGHHVYTSKDTRRLKTVIALYKRIEADEYEDYIYEEATKKFGPDDMYFVKIEPKEGETPNKYSGLSRMMSTRQDRMDEAQKAAYLKYKKAQYAACEVSRKQDMDLLGKMISKYSRKWWD